MMERKKKIAVFANGWSEEFVRMVLFGIRQSMEENHIDVFLFIDFTVASTDVENLGEANLIRLPRLEDFDGAIILANTFNIRSVLEELCSEIRRVGIPAVSLEGELEGIDYMGTENYFGMRTLAEHMIIEHGVRKVVFIGGPEGNGESNIRCNAVRAALEHNGLSLPDDCILQGNFADNHAQEVFAEWLQQHGELPDAIICANDSMAMGVCLWLQKHGYSVPRDVKVTGYDYLETARICYPSIASVGRDWDKMGYVAIQHLIARIEGKPVDRYTAMMARFIPAESCGCTFSEAEAARTHDIRNTSYGRKRENLDFDIRSCALYIELRGIRSSEEAADTFREAFASERKYEGDDFAICLVEDFFDTLIDARPLRVEGYGERMDVICQYRGGRPVERQYMDTRLLVPGYDEASDECNAYVFSPLHSGDKCMGYVVFRDPDVLMDNYRLFTWTKHMNQNLEQIRLNIRTEELNNRLVKLSVTDALTGIYNRLGYERYALPYLEQCKTEGKNGVLMFADINRMKDINDKYGHLQGDNAIQAVAGALQKAMPEGWIIVRYGGDEYLVAGECDSEDRILELEQKLQDALQEEIRERGIYFELTISVGTVQIDNDADLSMEESFKKADEAMYEMKKRNHAAESCDDD